MRVRSTLFLLAAALAGQEQRVKFTASSDLVVVNVGVEDRSGKPIEGLKKESFTVLEDGKPQAVSIFEFQKLTLDPLPLAPPPLDRALFEAPERVPDEPAIRPPEPGKVKYQDRRLLTFFFDFTSMPPADQVRAQQAALKFLSEQMSAADLVSIMTFTSRLKVEQDFTDDREALGEIIRSFRIGEMSELAEEGATGEEDLEDDTNTLFIADETEFNIFNTDRKLSALESAVRNLAVLPEKKALVYFSSGVGKTGVENQSQLRATINEAVRSGCGYFGTTLHRPCGWSRCWSFSMWNDQ